MVQTEKNENLRQRSIVSFLSLSLQSGYSAVLGLVANLVLTVLLPPSIFGIYFTTLSLIALLNYFSDIGLAASLIQKKEIDEDDIKTTFTVQQTLIITLITVGFFITSYVQSFYKLPQEGVYLYWALLGGFFVSSLKTIPSVFLERKIQFHKIVIIQILENTTFYVTVIILALLNFQLMSFVYAVLARAFIGLIGMYSISFWVPQIGFSRRHFKELVSFGLPFQASSFLALFKDDLIILFLGKVVGFEALGYIGWAKKWAEAPLRIIMDNVTKVLFPLISRMHGEKEKVSGLIERILYYETLLLAPALGMMAVLMHYAVELIPKYSKWEPALPLFYIFCLSALFTSFFAPLINVFNSMGKPKLAFFFMTFWTILTWVATPTFIRLFGLYGFPLAHLLLSSTFVIVVYVAKRMIPFRFFNSIVKPTIASISMIILSLVLQVFIPVSWLGGISIAVIGGLFYVSVLYFVFKISLIQEAKIFLKRD